MRYWVSISLQKLPKRCRFDEFHRFEFSRRLRLRLHFLGTFKSGSILTPMQHNKQRDLKVSKKSWADLEQNSWLYSAKHDKREEYKCQSSPEKLSRSFQGKSDFSRLHSSLPLFLILFPPVQEDKSQTAVRPISMYRCLKAVPNFSNTRGSINSVL